MRVYLDNDFHMVHIARCLVVLVFLNTVGYADAIEVQLGQSIAEAHAADQLEEAELLLDQAAQQLAATDLPRGSRQMRLLQADLRRARGQIIANALKLQPQATLLRERALSYLNPALRIYKKLRTEAVKQISLLTRQLRPEQRMETAAYRRASAMAAQTIYSIGWTHYLIGTIEMTGAAKQKQLRLAIANFRELTSDGFETNPIIIDCLIGQAMCYLELGEPHVAVKLLEPATPANTSPDAFKRLTMLRIRSFSEMRLYYQIEQSVSAYFAMQSTDHQRGMIEVGMAMERVVALAHLSEKKNDRGNRGLFYPYYVKCRDELYRQGHPWIERLIQKLGEEVESGGYASLLEARKKFSKEHFEDASKTARRGLSESAENGDRFLHAELLYVVGLASWNVRNWPLTFIAALEFIDRHKKDQRAEQLCLYAMEAAQRVRGTNNRLPSVSLMKMYDLAEAHFGHLPQVKQVPWYRAHLLLQTGRYGEAQRLLHDIPESSSMYWEAQYGLAMAALQLSATGDRDSSAMFLDSASAAINRFVEATPDPVPSDKQAVVRAVMSLAMNATSGWLSHSPSDTKKAMAVLDKIAELGVSRAHVRSAESALRLRINVLNSDAHETIDLIGQSLSANTIDSDLAASLTFLADHLESQYTKLATTDDRSTADRLGAHLANIYDRLLEYHGRQASGLQYETEVALRRRLASIQNRMGKSELSLPHYLWLVDNVPHEKSADILRGLALAYEGTDAMGEAVVIWQRLKKGLRTGSNDWVEACFHLIDCQMELGEYDLSYKLLNILLIQVPDALQGKWGVQIAEIKERIKMTVPPISDINNGDAEDQLDTSMAEMPGHAEKHQKAGAGNEAE